MRVPSLWLHLCSLPVMCRWASGSTKGVHRPAYLVDSWGPPLIHSHSVGQESTLSVALGSEHRSSTGGAMFFLASNAELIEMS